MKKLVIICIMLISISAVNAQTASATGKGDEARKTADQSAAKNGNEFAGTEMSVNNSKVTFSGLPQMSKAAWAIVTDRNGETVKQAKITASENTVDVQNLQKGMYFVTVMYRNASKKAFVLNL